MLVQEFLRTPPKLNDDLPDNQIKFLADLDRLTPTITEQRDTETQDAKRIIEKADERCMRRYMQLVNQLRTKHNV